MECVYEIFDFLSQEPILETVYKLHSESSRRFADAIDKTEFFKREGDEEKRQKYLSASIRNATIMHLCNLFMETKESHDTEVAIQSLLFLAKEEKSLVQKQEYEAARLKKNEQEKIRDYLLKKNKHVNRVTKEESIVNILRPIEVDRSSI